VKTAEASRLLDILRDAPETDFHHVVELQNGYAVSIVRKKPMTVAIAGLKPYPVGGSYGGAEGLFEVAVLWPGEDKSVGAPEGWLTAEEVASEVRRCSGFPVAE
jgi:hypothetical protein